MINIDTVIKAKNILVCGGVYSYVTELCGCEERSVNRILL